MTSTTGWWTALSAGSGGWPDRQAGCSGSCRPGTCAITRWAWREGRPPCSCMLRSGWGDNAMAAVNPGFPLLTTLVFLPAAGAALVAVVPEAREEQAKLVGLAVGIAEAALAVLLLVDFDKAQAGFQFVTRQNW